MMLATVGNRLEARRAVEALRSGVPSAAAVRALGSGQVDLEQKFVNCMQAVIALAPTRRQCPGLLVRGGFGEGKSHLLTCFEQLALDNGFAVSRIVISKETPLQVPLKLLRSATENLRVPHTIGRGLEEVGDLLRKQFGTPGFAELLRQLSQEKELDSRFAATLHIYHLGSEDEDLADRMLRFWAGDTLTVGEMKKYLRALDTVDYGFAPIRARDLALQTLTFLPRLIRAAGLQGWVLLIDELELVGRYSRLARGQSYAELARWMGMLEGDERRPGLLTVGAITADFASDVLGDKGDLDEMGVYLSMRDAELQRAAEHGMQLIAQAQLLQTPGRDLLHRTYRTMQALHGEAYAWSPPEVAWPEELGATPMRTFVRAWINAWDVRRLYPDQRADEMGYEVDQVQSDYAEAHDLVDPGEE